ncbi:RNA 2'-phosphotransferase [Mycobacterium sp. 663a-19]|uniref:RNA 2'-phosphotransferase n=1 Tax=Mycobacterium sp. 663a-19 TaxID=2986148 RepID=UPI002D1F7FFA|nr:RNA 2'-phosphotransferase [Mycobacterium sp. 663a-19]MEB3982022.1 RNA 2'-phosphotransferase [Mycobacterium sp. 663a-19]
MADELEVDLVALHVGSNHILNAIGEAAVDFVGHEDGLADAAPGWVGSSQQALGQLAARWEARHNQHRLRVGGLGTHVAEAMVTFATNEDSSAGALRSVLG